MSKICMHAKNTHPIYLKVGGKDGEGMFTIYTKCPANDDDIKGGRTCHVDKSFLEVKKSQMLEEEKYKGKHLIIYNRSKHGPLQYELQTLENFSGS